MKTIKEVMTPNAEMIGYDATLKQAAERMKDLNVGVLPVKQDGQPKGIVTDRDITVRGTAEGRDPNSAKVGEIMSVDLQWCYDDQNVKETSDLMKEKQIRRLIVKNRQDEVVGIVSVGDLCTSCNTELAGEIVEKISEPAQPER
ncbi:MAG: CBS domain-containing protein [Candidatus Omnitrophota bacterium]